MNKGREYFWKEKYFFFHYSNLKEKGSMQINKVYTTNTEAEESQFVQRQWKHKG